MKRCYDKYDASIKDKNKYMQTFNNNQGNYLIYFKFSYDCDKNLLANGFNEKGNKEHIVLKE